MEIKNKIAVWCLLCALMVALVPTCSAKAEEVETEWSNFGEYWIAQGKAIEDLPFEYDSEKNYLYAKWGTNGSYYYDYIFVWDNSVQPTWYISNGQYVYYTPSQFEGIYRIQYMSEYGDYTGSNGGGWNNIVTASTSTSTLYDAKREPYYTDADICTNTGITVYHKSKTGTNVSFEFALADMTDSLKTTLQSYDYYVVAKVPYRVNDWKSEQIMIAVSNGSKVVYRSEAYNQIHFSTGSGYEAGLSYIYCSECCKWEAFSSEKAYILGDTVVAGGKYPDVLWTNCDIYYEDGISYGLTDEIYFEAYPYSEDDVEEEEPLEIVTDGFPRLFEVTKAVAYVYTYADSSSAVVCAMPDGASGLVTGVEYDADGNAWYKVYRYYNGTEWIGYVSAEDIKVGYSAPSGGSSDVEVTPIPTDTPSSPDIEDTEIEGLDGLVDTMENLTELIGVVPMMIGAVFSFLPTWCLAVVGIGFAFMGLFLVIKLIRG